MDYEIVIVGGGVVGLACAAILSENYHNILLLERHPSFGYETSSRNSEVIHAGIYYPKDSLKAKLCVAGNKSLYEWCGKYNVPHKRIGKYIIAVQEDELENLDNLYIKARNNGVENISETSIEKLHNNNPAIKAVAALWSPDTGIIDSHRLMESFLLKAVENNCDFAWKHTLKGITKTNEGYCLDIIEPSGELCTITCSHLINSAGLDCDTVASMAGIDIDAANYRLNYSRGHYFRLTGKWLGKINNLIYPVPPVTVESLGVHVTLELEGQLKLGPDVQYLKNRIQDYSVPDERIDVFFEAAGRYIPDLQKEDIYPGQAGIRPKLQEHGGEFRDFIIKEESDRGLPGLINLIGIESPGLTSCIEIARLVEGML